MKLRQKRNKSIDKVDIERAMKATLSNTQAARYLGVSFPTYKRYAQLFKDENGVTYFEKHKNQSGAGVPKMALRKNHLNSKLGILDILEGRVNPTIYTFDKLKEMAIKEGLLVERCNRCGFHDTRVMDLKCPLILSYKDGNKRNIKHDNMEFLCYNCYFLTIGDVFDKKQIAEMEDYRTGTYNTIDMEFEPSHYQMINRERQSTNWQTAEEIIPKPVIEQPFIPESEIVSSVRPDDFGEDLISFSKYR